MNACEQFRARLASLLSGRVKAEAFGHLAWHEHLLACNACRALLDAEHALEVLLVSLPEPHLPPELARRVLAMLEPARSDQALDRLLDDSLDVPVPSDLARSVLSKLAATRHGPREASDDLERLLERLPQPAVPLDLARRVLARLARERRIVAARAPSLTAAHSVAPRVVALQRRRLLIAASFLAAVGLGAWVWTEFGPRSFDLRPRDDIVDGAPVQPDELRRIVPQMTPPSLLDEPPVDLLASLDLLESWELVTDESLEAELVLEGYDVLLFDADEASNAAEPAEQPERPRNG